MEYKNKKLEEFERKLKTEKVAIIGLGVSNSPLIDYLHDKQADVTVFDDREAEKLDEIFDAHIDVHTAASKLPSAHASILPPAIKISFILLPLVWTSFVISDI